MAYKNKVFVSLDADSDLRYYFLMRAWKQSDHSTFDFNDARDLNKIISHDEKPIKAALQKRLRSTKCFVLLVGESTRYLYKYVRWEIEQAIKRKLPIIVVNINGIRTKDEVKCPPILRDHLTMHVSYNSKILEYALENWPKIHAEKLKKADTESYFYEAEIYSELGI